MRALRRMAGLLRLVRHGSAYVPTPLVGLYTPGGYRVTDVLDYRQFSWGTAACVQATDGVEWVITWLPVGSLTVTSS